MFYDGERADDMAVSDMFKYPNMLVLVKDDERLVLIFNEDHEKTITGTLKNLNLKPGKKAEIWGWKGIIDNPTSMMITVAPQDVIAVHIK